MPVSSGNDCARLSADFSEVTIDFSAVMLDTLLKKSLFVERGAERLMWKTGRECGENSGSFISNSKLLFLTLTFQSQVP